MDNQVPNDTPRLLAQTKNPFKPGFKGLAQKDPAEKRPYDGRNKWTRKRSLLKVMLHTPLTAKDLPEHIADTLRAKFPGLLDDMKYKFTMWQVMEMLQIQLLFSKSDYVVQQAIDAIKDRVEGKPIQKVQMEQLEAEPTEFILPGGRVVVI